MERWQESEIVFKGKIVRLRVGTVLLDDGATAYREVVEHGGGVCVLPYTGHSVLLVRQYRIALEQDILEAPAGKLEGAEDPEHRGRCELEEEVGQTADHLLSVGYIYGTVGFCNEKIHLYIASGLHGTAQRLDEEERIEIVEMPIAEVRRNLRGNYFLDAKTDIILRRLMERIDAGIL